MQQVLTFSKVKDNFHIIHYNQNPFENYCCYNYSILHQCLPENHTTPLIRLILIMFFFFPTGNTAQHVGCKLLFKLRFVILTVSLE